MGDLFLREVVCDVDAFLSALAETAGKIKEGLGDTAGDVGEHKVRHLLVGLAETMGELVKHVLRHVRVGVDEAHEVCVRQGHEGRGGDGSCGGRAGALVEQGQLADDLAGAEDGDEILAAIIRGVAEFDLAINNNEQVLAGISFMEKGFAATEGLFRHQLGELSLILLGQASEELNRSDDAGLQCFLPFVNLSRRRRKNDNGNSQIRLSYVTEGIMVFMTAPQQKFPPRPRSKAARIDQAEAVNKALTSVYPDARCELDFTNPLELLVATMLSAQTTDVRVNSITPELFAEYPTPQAYADSDREHLESILRPLGFFRAKAKSLTGMGQALVERFDSEVPANLKDLVSLPGVGRKTANVVLGNAFDIPGITVDTHVNRLAGRLGWTRNTDAVKVEKDIAELLPEEEWTMACHRLIFHGRRICFARSPQCGICPIADLCPSAEIAGS